VTAGWRGRATERLLQYGKAARGELLAPRGDYLVDAWSEKRTAISLILTANLFYAQNHYYLKQQ